MTGWIDIDDPGEACPRLLLVGSWLLSTAVCIAAAVRWALR